jgi:hypothetical protein
MRGLRAPVPESRIIAATPFLAISWTFADGIGSHPADHGKKGSDTRGRTADTRFSAKI